MSYKVPAYIIMLGWLVSAAAQPIENAGLEMLKSTPTKGYDYGWWTPLAAAPSVLHWRFGIDLEDLASNFHTALGEAAAVKKIANYVGGERQRASLEIPRTLGPGLYPGELRAVSRWSPSVIAYRIRAFPPQEAALQTLFDFARTMKIETIVSDSVPEHGDFIDFLAHEYEINVALCGPYRSVINALAHTGPRVGACLNSAKLSEEGITVDKAVAALGDRIQVVELQSLGDGGADWTGLFRALYDHGVKPSLFVVRAADPAEKSPAADLQRSVDTLDTALRPLIADQAALASRRPDLGRIEETPEQRTELVYFRGNSTSWDPATPDSRAAIDSALPRRALVKPKRPRTLLVIDLNLGYPGHSSIPTHNYGIEQLGIRTGAYRAVFDNNLENLKYPAIKRFDAIFLNNTAGPIFEDPNVRSGLVRYVREGGGLGANHASTHTALDWPEFAQMLGAAAGVEEDADERIWLKLDDPHSPLNAGFNNRELLYKDQLFRFTGAPYSRDVLHILLSVDVQKTDMFQIDRTDLSKQELSSLHPMLGRHDADYAVSWIRAYGRGRVFYTVLGHNPTLFSTPQLARHLLGGIQYILGDLAADATPSARLGKRENP